MLELPDLVPKHPTHRLREAVLQGSLTQPEFVNCLTASQGLLSYRLQTQGLLPCQLEKGDVQHA